MGTTDAKNKKQTQYHFLSGFTEKLAGTERGVNEPTPTFSACFGAAFLSLHPTKYAEVLLKRMKTSNANAYLVNTGWNGKGERISLKDTRLIINAILNEELDIKNFTNLPIFNLQIPSNLNGVDSKILDPRKSWKNDEVWKAKANELAKLFINNFDQFCDNINGKDLVKYGPTIE